MQFKIKIFFPIGAFYPSQIGGPCNSLYWHTYGLNKHDIKIDIVTTTIGIKKGLVKKNVSYDNECGTVFYGEGNERSIKIIKKAVKITRSADIIHLNSLFNFISIIVFFYAKMFCKNIPIVWSVRGELNAKALIYSKWKKIIVLFFYKLFSKNVVFHGTSNQEINDICSHFKNSKVIQIPNLIKPFDRIFQDGIKKNLLFVGRIHPIKAIHKIIEGLSLSEKFLNSDFNFIVIGDFEDRYKYYFDDLILLIEVKGLINKIEFRGYLGGYEKERIYAESYATLLMSDTENFGNVVTESLNQGTPVITSKGTPWSILEEFNCGYCVSNEPSIIAKTIDLILDLQQDQYLKMRKNAIQLVEDKFNINSQIYQWLIQYKALYNANKQALE